MRAVLDLASAMSDLGHRVTLLTLDPADAPVEWPRATSITELALMPIGRTPVVFVPRHSSPGRRFRRGLGHREMTSLVGSADVLHVHGVWEWCNLQALAAARRGGVPAVVTPHGMLDDWCMQQGGIKKQLFLRLFLRRALAVGVHVHFTASAEQAQAGTWLGEPPSSVIPYVVDVSVYQRSPLSDSPPILDRTRHVLLLSRLHPKKGVERLIDAAAIVAQRMPGVRWTVAGPADADYLSLLQERVRDRGLSHAFTFAGMVSGQEKADLYRSAHLFVLPTSQENFGIVLIEAMASGLPVITTRGVDIWPELQDAGAVILEQADAATLADAICPMLQDEVHRRQLCTRGRAWVEATFAGDAVPRRFELLYQSLSTARG